MSIISEMSCLVSVLVSPSYIASQPVNRTTEMTIAENKNDSFFSLESSCFEMLGY